MLFNKAREAIGLEIGDGMVKAMHMQVSPKENRLLGFAMVPVNFREGRQGIVNAIKEVLAQLEAKPKKHRVNISVSGESVMVRDIHWPQMADEEIRRALKFEVERQVHFKAEEVVFDYYSVMDKSIAETKTRVVLVAAKKDLIENYASLITAAGYECGFVEVDTFSLLNGFYLSGPAVVAEKTVAILNVGMEVTNIDIIRGRIVGLTKDAFVAWGNLADALPPEIELDFNTITQLKGLLGSDDVYELALFIMNALSNQVRRTIEYYESQGRDTVEEIFLSGRIAMYKNLDKYLQNILGLKVTAWNPLEKVRCDGPVHTKHDLKKNAPMLALCTGLACYREFEINLASTKKIAKPNKLLIALAKHRMLVLIAGLVMVFLFGLWALMLSQLKLRQQAVARLEKSNAEVQQVLQDIEQLKQGRQRLESHMAVARSLLSHNLSWGRKLSQISAQLPGGVWLKEISLKDRSGARKPGSSSGQEGAGDVIYLRGIAYALSGDEMLTQINAFVHDLKNSSEFAADFERIELVRSNRETLQNANVMQFEIECTLR